MCCRKPLLNTLLSNDVCDFVGTRLRSMRLASVGFKNKSDGDFYAYCGQTRREVMEEQEAKQQGLTRIEVPFFFQPAYRKLIFIRVRTTKTKSSN